MRSKNNPRWVLALGWRLGWDSGIGAGYSDPRPEVTRCPSLIWIAWKIFDFIRIFKFYVTNDQETNQIIIFSMLFVFQLGSIVSWSLSQQYYVLINEIVLISCQKNV